jgi:phosphoserine phosphatase
MRMPCFLPIPLAALCALASCIPRAEPADSPASRQQRDRELGRRDCRPAPLRADLPWYGGNRQTLTGWIDAAGCASSSYDRDHLPVALFDWDNTVSKNDVGDAITFHLIRHDKVLQPPAQDWKRTSRYLTDEAAAALSAACGKDIAAGQPLPTTSKPACADEILSVYIDSKTRGGAAAFAGWNHLRMEPAYAWTAQLLAGYTPAEVSRLALAAVLPQLSAPQGTMQTVGTRSVNGWIRLYDQSKDLIRALQSRGYDVWIITASPQDVVAALAPLAGISPTRVIGIRSLSDAAGRLTAAFEGCGPVAAGDGSMITYREGKRCWVNQIVYGDRTPRAIERRPAGARQSFAAGDSDTDLEFLRDARYKLAINRNKSELMCFAYRDEQSSWLVNPMFLEPRPARATAYPCSTTACLAADGTGGPCRDEAGAIIPDQLDAVHP